MSIETLKMEDKRFQLIIVIRIVFILLGGSLIIFAFAADKLGFGDIGSFGIGQVLLLLFGVLITSLGIFGKKFFQLYRDGAVIFLNLLLLIALVEVGSIATGRLVQGTKHVSIEDLPYYATQDWTKEYWQEELAELRFRYKPFVIWNHVPFHGKYVNVNSRGYRETPGAQCHTGAYKIFTFGGSTMFGWGSPDWGTIPAYLQKELEEVLNKTVCVQNYAQDGFVSTQSLITLMKQLQAGNIPDMVIFYDGVNEVIAAYESGQAGTHVTMRKIASKFEKPENPLLQWYKGSRQFTLLNKLISKYRERSPGMNSVYYNHQGKKADMDVLADSVVGTYLTNYRILGALAEEYGFKYSFFLQPYIAIGNKALTKEEQIMKAGLTPVMIELTNAVYQRIASATPNYKNLYYMGNIFDGKDFQIWFDDVSHITPEGNHLVAQYILTMIDDQLPKENRQPESQIDFQ